MNNARRVGIIVIIFILIAILLVILIPNFSNTYTYTGSSGEKFTFTKARVGDLTMHVLTTYTKYKNDNKNYQQVIPLRYGPKELENIKADKNINDKILNKKYIYITLNPNMTGDALLASIDIAKVTGTADYSVFKIPTQGALVHPTNNSNASETPIITCNNANKDIGVIRMYIGKENRIASLKECVVVEAINDKDLIKVADRLVYNLLGVM